jgi:P-type E1-E2 ATPase
LSETIWLGSPRLMEQSQLRFPPSLRQALSDAGGRQPVVCLGWQGSVRAVFMLAEQWRSEAHRVLDCLTRTGIKVRVLTGDLAARGDELSRQLGVDVEAGLLPAEKQRAVVDMRKQAGAVAMVGDGINDAPALAAADVGIAMGCGTDVTRDAADVCLLGDDLSMLLWSIELARRAKRVIRQNLFWAFVYNGGGIALAAAGWLNPVWAAVAMVGSSLLVVGNSQRLSAPVTGNLPHHAGRVPVATPSLTGEA